MAVLGVVTINVDKSLIQPHAAQFAQFAVNIFSDQNIVDRDGRESVAAVKIERLAVHVL